MVFIISDHGFQSYNGVFNLAKWALNKGLMHITSQKSNYVSKDRVIRTIHVITKPLRMILKYVLERLLPDYLYVKILRSYSKAISDKKSVFNKQLSIIFVLGHTNLVGAIYLNKEHESIRSVNKNLFCTMIKQMLVNDLKEYLGKHIDVEVHMINNSIRAKK